MKTLEPFKFKPIAYFLTIIACHCGFATSGANAAPDLKAITFISISDGEWRNAGTDSRLYWVPVSVIIENTGDETAPPFKLSARMVGDRTPDSGFTVPFNASSGFMGSSSVFYPWVNALAAGDSITVNGEIGIREENIDESVRLNVIVDSCDGEEFQPVFCRVQENDEDNVSPDVIVMVPSAARNIACIHSPIIPQPGQPVTIEAVAYDNTLPMRQRPADIDIWVARDGRNRTRLRTCTNATSCSATVSGAQTRGVSELAYNCDIRRPSIAGTGWRTTQVGNGPVSQDAIPVVFTAPSENAIDVVLVAAGTNPRDGNNDYPGGFNDPNFMADVRTSIMDALYAERVYLKNQQNLNFWIARQPGRIANPSAGDGCPNFANTVVPANLGFAESRALVHRFNMRDCAWISVGLFTAEPDTSSSGRTAAVFIHEISHAPFGLMDEYCCDSNYRENRPFTNIYASLADCRADPLSRFVTNSCRPVNEASQICSGGDPTAVNFWRVDAAPARNDLMACANINAQPADERRINWLFQRCRTGTC